jgi:hypothetical protein
VREIACNNKQGKKKVGQVTRQHLGFSIMIHRQSKRINQSKTRRRNDDQPTVVPHTYLLASLCSNDLLILFRAPPPLVVGDANTKYGTTFGSFREETINQSVAIVFVGNTNGSIGKNLHPVEAV